MPDFTVATWNVNSLKVRLPHVLDWLAANPIDALCLQELKLDQDKFPLAAFEDIGYTACWSGQKTYNGVAIISRHAGLEPVCDLPGFDDVQRRVMAATLDGPQGPVRLINLYCPNGQSLDSDKYAYKLAWFAALRDWLQAELARHPDLIVVGDFNIAPADEDVHDPAAWAGGVLVSAPERAAWQALLDLGLHDAFRLFEQAPASYSWWDYRQGAFRRNAGLRIDHVLLSDSLRARCTACVVDTAPRRLAQPSDHAPVIATLARA